VSAWYYLVDQEQKGPYTDEEIRAFLTSHALPPDTFLWHEGLENWTLASDVPEFAGTLSSNAAPPPKAEPVAVAETFPVTLVQTDLLRRTQSFELLSVHALRFKSGSGKKAKEIVISLKGLKPEAERVRRLHYKSLLAIVPLGLFTLIFCVSAVIAFFGAEGRAAAGMILVTALVLIVPTVYFVVAMYRKSVDSLVFPAYTMTPLELWYNKPDPAAFDAFVARLTSAIATVTEAPITEMDQGPGKSAYAPGPKGCVECKSPDVVPGFATLLCQPCRDKYSAFRIPIWLKITAAAIAVGFLVSAVRLPGEMLAAIASARGDAAEARGDHTTAIADYGRTLASYPDAHDALVGMAQAELHAGDRQTALDYANKLVRPTGEVSKDDLALINEIKGAKP
jgi:hypothetical protein